MIRVVASMSLAFLLGACGSLRLEVAVLDPKIVKSLAQDDRIQKELPVVVAESDIEIDGRFNNTFNAHYLAYTKTATEYRKQAAALPPNDEQRDLLEGAAASLDDFSEPMRQLYDDKKAALKANSKTLREAWKEYKAAPSEAAEVVEKRRALTREERETTRNDYAALSDSTTKGIARSRLTLALEERQRIESSFSRTVQLDLNGLEESAEKLLTQIRVPAGKALVASTAETQTQAAQTITTVKQLFSHGGLPLSPYAYYVASAPVEAWAKDYDRSKAHGFFGNTDIAIKALGEGTYTLKGVSFNPADVASAASKVGTQMVMLAAQIGGVPVKLSSTSSSTPAAETPAAGPPDGTALATSSGRLAGVLEGQSVAGEKIAAQREGLLRIAAAIIREKDALESGNGAPLKAALAAIRASYESHAPRLTITITPSVDEAKP
jgi:hypothetical protein